jgi:hypothetical protein
MATGCLLPARNPSAFWCRKREATLGSKAGGGKQEAISGQLVVFRL